jgi:hypothetical protein
MAGRGDSERAGGEAAAAPPRLECGGGESLRSITAPIIPSAASLSSGDGAGGVPFAAEAAVSGDGAAGGSGVAVYRQP